MCSLRFTTGTQWTKSLKLRCLIKAKLFLVLARIYQLKYIGSKETKHRLLKLLMNSSFQLFGMNCSKLIQRQLQKQKGQFLKIQSVRLLSLQMVR